MNVAKKPKTGGRQKGVPNKMTTQLREMILGALNDVGGQKYLAKQAKDNPGPFMTLLGKVLPTQLTGAGGGPLQTIDLTNLSDEDIDRLEAIFGPLAGSSDDPARPQG